MPAGADSRKLSMALVLMMAVVAIAIPTCTMVGCDMGMGAGMPYMPSGTGIYNACPGDWVTTTGPAGVLPSGAESLLVALSAAVFVAALALAPRTQTTAVRLVDAEPPPPPTDPLGQRTRI